MWLPDMHDIHLPSIGFLVYMTTKVSILFCNTPLPRGYSSIFSKKLNTSSKLTEQGMFLRKNETNQIIVPD